MGVNKRVRRFEFQDSKNGEKGVNDRRNCTNT